MTWFNSTSLNSIHHRIAHNRHNKHSFKYGTIDKFRLNVNFYCSIFIYFLFDDALHLSFSGFVTNSTLKYIYTYKETIIIHRTLSIDQKIKKYFL